MPDKWKKMPNGWTDESRRKFWNSLTGEVKHRVTKCMKEMDGKVDDPGAFCASLADRVEGKGWRSASESPRPSCILCVKKHLGQAAVLFQEALQGYPAHRWLAIGHLAEAEAESQEMAPEFADLLRQERKKAEVGDYVPDCTDLLMKCGELDGSEMGYEATASRVASRFMRAEDYSYFINPKQTNTTRYVVMDGSGVFYTGRVGIKNGESYIKFVAEPVRVQGKYRNLFDSGALRELSRNKFLDAIEDETYFTNIDVKRLYQS